MPSSAHWPFRPCPVFCTVVVSFASLLAGCGVSGTPQSVSIPALAAEDLLGPCRFDLSIAQPANLQRGILVLYERGDTYLLYNDLALRKMVSALDYSLVWAHQCNARSTGDIQADASKGPGRMLVAALNQLSVKSGHPELATIGTILYGFSAAGVLTATMANDQPDRLLGTIQYAAGSAYTDLNDVPVSAAASRIPALILANSSDRQAGTDRSHDYFQRGRLDGAAWAYAVQNDTTHCCNLTTRSIILPWIEAVANAARVVGESSAPTDGTAATFVCTPDGVEDAESDIDCNFTVANLGAATSAREESAWLPNQASGAAWLAWVTNRGPN